MHVAVSIDRNESGRVVNEGGWYRDRTTVELDRDRSGATQHDAKRCLATERKRGTGSRVTVITTNFTRVVDLDP